MDASVPGHRVTVVILALALIYRRLRVVIYTLAILLIILIDIVRISTFLSTCLLYIELIVVRTSLTI